MTEPITPSPADVVIDKVNWNGTKVRIEYQRRRPDNRYDELVIASFDWPTRAFILALNELWQDVCFIAEFHESYRQGLVVRGVSFTYKDGVMGACITALKSVAAARSPLVINTPFITDGPMNDGDPGPFLDPAMVERLDLVRAHAIRYINGDREQPTLDFEESETADPDYVAPPNAGEGVLDYSKRLGVDLEMAITDPTNPILQRFAHKLRGTSIIGPSGRRIDIDEHGVISTPQN